LNEEYAKVKLLGDRPHMDEKVRDMVLVSLIQRREYSIKKVDDGLFTLLKTFQV